MTHRHLLIAAVLAAAVVFGLSMLGGRSSGSEQAAPRAAASPNTGAVLTPKAPPGEGLVSAPPPVARLSDQPAWRAAAASSPAGRSPAEDKARSERAARMAAVKRSLDQMSAEDRQDPRKVSDALLSLEQANGSPNLSGIRLDVLRQNLAIAAEMQKLANELQALRAEIPEGKQPTPALAERIKVKLAQIGAVQKQLRTDFMDASVASGAAAMGQ
jgi:hypothetical protein